MPKVRLEMLSFSKSGKTRVSGKLSAGTAGPIRGNGHGLQQVLNAFFVYCPRRTDK
jgi:hypothetical protein